MVYAGLRPAGQDTQGAWRNPVRTNIPNDESNLNTGLLGDGRRYLLNNAVFEPKEEPGGAPTAPRTLRFRDPVVLATSGDGGRTFGAAFGVISCTALPAGSNSTCTPRTPGGGKNPGPSYPQGMAVVAPAPEAHRGFWVTATVNKEDLWITRVPPGGIPGQR